MCSFHCSKPFHSYVVTWQGTDGDVHGEAPQAHGICGNCSNPGQSVVVREQDGLQTTHCITMHVTIVATHTAAMSPQAGGRGRGEGNLKTLRPLPPSPLPRPLSLPFGSSWMQYDWHKVTDPL